MLRDARLDDLPALLALEAQFPGDRLSARQMRHHLRSPRAILRVASAGGTGAATGGAVAKRAGAAEGQPHDSAAPHGAAARSVSGEPAIAGYALVFLRAGAGRARLYSIAVDRAARGQGWGAALLRDAEDAARRAGALALRLEVRADNGVAIGLYEAAGYRLFGRHAGYYQDGADALRFEKPLVRADAATPGHR